MQIAANDPRETSSHPDLDKLIARPKQSTTDTPEAIRPAVLHPVDCMHQFNLERLESQILKPRADIAAARQYLPQLLPLGIRVQASPLSLLVASRSN